ncbi:MAG TPA: hypothetical protein VFF04_06815 [Candidatus Babeliales bacterium]|nr:hypothetical protein [Candidatus Babeliales bacterium]
MKFSLSIFTAALVIGSNLNAAPEQTQLAAKQPQKRSIIQKEHTEVINAVKATNATLVESMQCQKEAEETLNEHRTETNKKYERILSTLDTAKNRMLEILESNRNAIVASQKAQNNKFDAQEQAIRETSSECAKQKQALQEALADFQKTLHDAQDALQQMQEEAKGVKGASDKEMAIFTKNQAQKEKTYRDKVITAGRKVAAIANDITQNGTGFRSLFSRGKKI